MNETMSFEGDAHVTFLTREGRRIWRCTARVARDWSSRLVGLLLTKLEHAGPVLLADCSSVHTIGMRYPIDIALIGDGQVLRSERAVGSGHVVRAKGASWVLERPASDEPWPEKGDLARIDASSQSGWAALLRAPLEQMAEVA